MNGKSRLSCKDYYPRRLPLRKKVLGSSPTRQEFWHTICGKELHPQSSRNFCNCTDNDDNSPSIIPQLQPWVVFTAKERVSAPLPSLTRAPCLPGSRAPRTMSSIKSANLPERVPRPLRSVLCCEIAMALPKLRSSLV